MLAALVLAALLQENVVTKADPAQTYTLILPDGYDPAKTYPLLFVFDPRGRGTMTAELFRDAAEELGWIVISSNNTRSDGPMEPNERALQALVPEAFGQYSVDRNRVYATGFSGTTLLGWSLAVKGIVAGVIGVGSHPLDPLPAREFKFAHYGFAGDADFNNSLMRQIDAAIVNAPHRFESFPGRHQWPPRELVRDALVWLEVLAMKENRRARDDAFIAKAFARDATLAAALPPLESLRRYRAIVATYDGLHPIDDAKAALARLEKDPAVKREREAEAKWDAFEERFLTDAFKRLATTIAELRADPSADVKGHFLRELRVAEMKKRAGREGAEGRTARRILANMHVQMSFYLPREFETRGEKWLVDGARAAAEEIVR